MNSMTGKSGMKALITRVFPQTRVMGERLRRRQEKRVDRRLQQILTQYLAEHGAVVQSGPFAGMRYLETAVGSALIPKLLGSYESELHGFVERILKREYEEILDVGCAEGFYAVGLAVRHPAKRIKAFDIDPVGRQLCRQLSERNKVGDRVSIEEFCSVETLRSVTAHRALLVCDCEGYENELLRPDLVPAMGGWDILVELHEFIVPGFRATLTERFSATHNLEFVGREPRDSSKYPLLEVLGETDRNIALSEHRGYPQDWCYLTPK